MAWSVSGGARRKRISFVTAILICVMVCSVDPFGRAFNILQLRSSGSRIRATDSMRSTVQPLPVKLPNVTSEVNPLESVAKTAIALLAACVVCFAQADSASARGFSSFRKVARAAVATEVSLHPRKLPTRTLANAVNPAVDSSKVASQGSR